MVCLTATSQHLIFGNPKASVEVGVTFGPSFFLGDLGGNKGIGTRFLKDLNLQLTKLMKGGFVTVNPNEWIGFRLGAQYTYVEGRDEIIKNSGGQELTRKQRNLDFRSKVWEAYAAIEFSPTAYAMRNTENESRLRPYFFAGVGAFHFNPQGSLADAEGNIRWYDLRPLRTEGQGMSEYPDRKQYKLTQINIPMGGGIKYFLSPKVNIGLEIAYRKSFTDYIDDVSTKYIDPKYFDKYLTPENALVAKEIYNKIGVTYFRGTWGYPGDKRGTETNADAYFTVGFKIGVRIGHEFEGPERWRERRQTKCPVRF
ncbi:hypothetical protein ACQ33O_00565 [Ferruginibacter sp. SUN002]|uniref:hypothetical protein n=1 Tax=Ferruginibacter sp. SUN002 TaxID=2937789 RepID=UPI003D369740